MMAAQRMLAGPARSRLVLAVYTGLVITLGLLSRTEMSIFPALLGKYPGDALCALMVWLGWAMVLPHADGDVLGWMALLTAGAVEWSQLYKAPWLDALRGTTAGHLVLGSGFAVHDILAYAVGIAAGVAIDRVLCKIHLVFSLDNHPGGNHV
jgi:hypothetical protein